jgi:hypothetical protein
MKLRKKKNHLATLFYGAAAYIFRIRIILGLEIKQTRRIIKTT